MCVCVCLSVCLYSVLEGWRAGPLVEGFIAATGKGVWIEDDQAGSPEERLSPVSSCLVPSRPVLPPVRPFPIAQAQRNWQTKVKIY